MENTNDATWIAAGGGVPDARKPGPKGKVLEPYAKEILLMAREGRSMQGIVNWLAEAPRHVNLSRQAVHQWIKARLRKLKRLNTEFAEAGISAPFWELGTPLGRVPLSTTSGPDPPMGGTKALAPLTATTDKRPSKVESEPRPPPDLRKYMVDAGELNRAQNAFKSK